MKFGLYILNPDHSVSKIDDLMEWAENFERPSCQICKTNLPHGVFVSTVFLGLDHSWGEGPPILFETMIFNGPFDESQERYATWDEAIAGHKITVAACEAASLWQHLRYIAMSHVKHYFHKVRRFIKQI